MRAVESRKSQSKSRILQNLAQNEDHSYSRNEIGDSIPKVHIGNFESADDFLQILDNLVERQSKKRKQVIHGFQELGTDIFYTDFGTIRHNNQYLSFEPNLEEVQNPEAANKNFITQGSNSMSSSNGDDTPPNFADFSDVIVKIVSILERYGSSNDVIVQ